MLHEDGQHQWKARSHSVIAQTSPRTNVHENALQLIQYCTGGLLPLRAEMGKFLVQGEHVQEPLDWGVRVPPRKSTEGRTGRAHGDGREWNQEQMGLGLWTWE